MALINSDFVIPSTQHRESIIFFISGSNLHETGIISRFVFAFFILCFLRKRILTVFKTKGQFGRLKFGIWKSDSY